jgi:Tol biopolymer transport system component
MALALWPTWSSRADAVVKAERTIPGRLIATREWLFDCGDECQPPGGYYQLASAGPESRFKLWRPLGKDQSLALGVAPAISPDGGWLVYATWRGELAVQRLDLTRQRFSGQRHVLALTGLTDGLPAVSWSPDSRRLVLGGTVHAKGGLWIVRRNGLGLRRVVCDCRVAVPNHAGQDETPVWSRRGAIAFVGSTPGQPATSVSLAIYIVRPDGTHLRALTAPAPKPIGGGFSFVEDSGPAWSPDGRRLVFAHDAAGGSGDLRILTVAGRRQRRLGVTGAAGAWSPDGRSIAYITAFGAGVRVVPVNGGPARDLVVPDWGGSLSSLDWRSPSIGHLTRTFSTTLGPYLGQAWTG